MFFDMDEAGQAAALKSAELAFQKDINVSIVQLKEGKDAADAVKENPKEFLKAVEDSVSAMEHFFKQAFKTHSVKNAQGKKTIARDLLNIIKNFSSEIEKTHWIKKLAQGLEVDEKILLDTLNKAGARTFIGKANREDEEGEEETLTEEKRSKIIGRKIIGLALANSRAWKKIVEEEAKFRALFQNDGLFVEVLAKGAPAEFDFEKLLTLLDNEAQRKISRKLYFEARYQFEENQEIKENSLKDSWSLIKQYLEDAKEELYKEKLKAIIKDIEKAEKTGDKKSAKLLMEEFSKISQKLK